MRNSSRPADWQLRLIQLLAVPGMIVAFYLLLFHEGVLVNVCAPSGWDDCGRVSGPGAPYAAIGPIPVALIGLVGYAAIFLVVWLKEWSPRLATLMPELIVGLVGVAFLFTLGLTALEVFVIHSLCRFCLVSAAIILVMAGLAVSYLRAANAAALSVE